MAAEVSMTYALWLPALSALLAAGPALATWPDDPAANLPIGTLTGAEVQPKVVATLDGGVYVCWFAGSGFDVRLQRLDADGEPCWAPGGVLIADRSFSSTQDHDLALDGSGDALLAFRDDRFGGVRITAIRVGADGVASAWGATGVQFGNGVDFVAAPKIVATADGDAVVAWTNDAEVHLQRIEPSGTLGWPGATVIADPAAQLSASDLVPSIAGDVLLSWVQQISFPSPKHLYVQRVNAAGAEAWLDRVAVFDGGSLQFGNFPAFVSDDAGGGVFGWYGVGPLQCYVQRVDATGTELFPHDGVAASTNLTRLRTAPAVSFDASRGTIFLFWREQNSLQSLSGVYGQAFDAGGVRQWGDEGVEVVPVDGQRTQVRAMAPGNGAGVLTFFADELAIGHKEVRGALLDAAGRSAWGGIVDVSTAVSDKSRLAGALTTSGMTVLAWADTRGDGDLYAQNVNPDGSLGSVSVPGDIDGDGVVGIDDLLVLLGAWGPCPGCPADVDGDGVVGIDDLLTLLGNWT